MRRDDHDSATTQADYIALNRIIAVSQGARAQVVCVRAAEASAMWLAAPPPLAVIDLQGDLKTQGTATAALAEIVPAIETLASQKQMDALQHQGFGIHRTEELHLWLVCEVEPPETAALDSVDGGNEAGWVALAELLTDVAGEVRRRLRLRLAVHALFLAPPLAQAQLACGARRLAAAGAGELFVAGPINQFHESVDEATWLHNAAMALAGLWWGVWPSYAASAGADTIRAVGASAWPSAAPAVRRWLMVRIIAEAAVQLLSFPGEPELPGGVAELGASLRHVLDDPRRMAAELNSFVPGPSAIDAQRFGHPAWENLAILPQQLAATMARREEQDRAIARQARNNWLDGWVDRWSSWRSAVETAELRPTSAIPVLPCYQRELEVVDATLHACLEEIDSALEQCSAALSVAEAARATAHRRVVEVCTTFPAYSLRGVVGAYLQPWRWPGWFLGYYRTLPQRLGVVGVAEARRRSLVWQEANWHVLRQLALSAQQQVRRELAAATHIRQRLADLSQWAREQQAILATHEIAPWKPATLESLWVKTCAASLPHRLATTLEARPLTSWPAAPTAELAEDLTGALAGNPPPIADWTALDCLTGGLDAAGELRQTDAAGADYGLSRWLSVQAQRAAPLWPRPAISAAQPEACWLLLPASTTWPRGRRAALSPSGEERVERWTQRQRNAVAGGACAGDALVFVRWQLVAVEDLEVEAEE